MTSKNRSKNCINCRSEFHEKPRESNKQWDAREYCSMQCNNSSQKRVTCIFERLERFQIISDGCWSWSGAKDGNGYGIISNRNKGDKSPEKAHRVSYEKHNGEIPKGMVIRHMCDNPECTNPEHLEIGTQTDNMQDCSKRKRLNPKSFDNLKAGAKGYRGAAVDKNKV